ncbi:MAG: polyphosphate polymerase domain-containing protein [Alistipes sp.]|nr:polyphosphate polymerase domain-containing protein [Alistipes sp.]
MQRAQLTYDELNALEVWQRMSPITLDEMRGVKLMNRIDTKYVLTEDEVVRFLELAADEGYRVQQIGSVRAARYDTLYYDTEERAMYIAHHNQQLTRQKIRARTYVDGGGSFVEVKNKSNRGRTRKVRVAIAESEVDNYRLNAEARRFVEENARYTEESLMPSLRTRFVRITLVNSTLTERLTIDLCLTSEDVRTATTAKIERMAILELKQDGRTRSTAKQLLLTMRIAPLKVSKYCIGTALTVEGIKRNRFEEKLRFIDKQLNRDNYDKI